MSVVAKERVPASLLAERGSDQMARGLRPFGPPRPSCGCRLKGCSGREAVPGLKRGC